MELAAHDQAFRRSSAPAPPVRIAYRMLGSVAEAMTLCKMSGCDGSPQSKTHLAYLATTATGPAINVAQSARSRREAYVGTWLPEPVDTSADPRLGAERGEALELAVLLLEKLALTYDQIAEVLHVSEENARQLVSRACKHIAVGHRFLFGSYSDGGGVVRGAEAGGGRERVAKFISALSSHSGQA